jgi:hypothetical protein
MCLIGNQVVIVRCSVLLRGSGSPAYDHRVQGAGDHDGITLLAVAPGLCSSAAAVPMGLD